MTVEETIMKALSDYHKYNYESKNLSILMNESDADDLLNELSKVYEIDEDTNIVEYQGLKIVRINEIKKGNIYLVNNFKTN